MYKKATRYTSKQANVMEIANPSEQTSEATRQQFVEKMFLQMSCGKNMIEVFKIRMLLKSTWHRIKSPLGIDVPITNEKEHDLVLKYHVTLNDSISYDVFLKIYQELTAEADESEQDITSSEYGNNDSLYLNIVDAFVALGGTADLKGLISKEKIVSVLLKDFELTLDISVFLYLNSVRNTCKFWAKM